jgi:hypothetical protein
MHEGGDDAVATAFFRAIQALENMLATLERTACATAGLREPCLARRLDELARDVEYSLHGLRSVAEARDAATRRHGH